MLNFILDLIFPKPEIVYDTSHCNENQIKYLLCESEVDFKLKCLDVVKEISDAIKNKRSRPSDLEALEWTKAEFVLYANNLKKALLLRLQEMKKEDAMREQARKGSQIENWET